MTLFVLQILEIKGKESETVKSNQNENISKTKLFGANFIQTGLWTRKLLTVESLEM